NSAFFSKVTEKGISETGGAAAAGSAPSRAAAAPSKEKITSMMQKFENMSLDNMLWEIIHQAIPDPDEQKKIFEIIFKQIQSELVTQVEKATHVIKQEKQKITNEQQRMESVVQTMAE